MHFLNVNVHFALGALLHVLLELIDFRAFASDDDARTSCENPHYQFVGGAFNFDRADARGLQLFFQFLAQLHIFMKQFSVIATGVPARLPRLVVAEAESVWMRFLSHGFPLVGLSLLALLCSLLLSGQSFAYATLRPTYAFVGFRFRHVAGIAFRRSQMGVANPHP